MDLCRYTLIQTHRMYDSTGESQCKPWTLGDYDASTVTNTTGDPVAGSLTSGGRKTFAPKVFHFVVTKKTFACQVKRRQGKSLFLQVSCFRFPSKRKGLLRCVIGLSQNSQSHRARRPMAGGSPYRGGREHTRELEEQTPEPVQSPLSMPSD